MVYKDLQSPSGTVSDSLLSGGYRDIREKTLVWGLCDLCWEGEIPPIMISVVPKKNVPSENT
jgi:hypothetical protein